MPSTLTTHDTRFDDPDGATIAKVLASLDGGRNVIATLEHSESTYLQAEGSAQAGFALEHQEGSLDRRYKSREQRLPLAQATEVFQNYARGDADWSRGLTWEHVPYVVPPTPWFGTWWAYVGAILLAAGLIWWWRG